MLKYQLDQLLTYHMKKFHILVQYSTCIWDKDTDEMIWWPSEVYACEGNFYLSLSDYVTKNGCHPNYYFRSHLR